MKRSTTSNSSIRKPNKDHHANLMIRWRLETSAPWSSKPLAIAQERKIVHLLDATWIVCHEAVYKVEHSSVRKHNRDHHASLINVHSLSRASKTTSASIDEVNVIIFKVAAPEKTIAVLRTASCTQWVSHRARMAKGDPVESSPMNPTPDSPMVH